MIGRECPLCGNDVKIKDLANGFLECPDCKSVFHPGVVEREKALEVVNLDKKFGGPYPAPGSLFYFEFKILDENGQPKEIYGYGELSSKEVIQLG